MENLNEDDVRITVIGVGGAGNNVVDRIVKDKVTQENEAYSSIKYVIVNTDKQALEHSDVEDKVLIGKSNKGKGAGGKPEEGKRAAEESESELKEIVKDAHLVFITAGLGGGTGTGASPLIAKLAKEAGALVIAVVSTPFQTEGPLRMQKAIDGVEKLKEYADSYIVVDNDKLMTDENMDCAYSEVLRIADEPLKEAILGIASVVLEYCNIVNADFADLKSIMENKGKAHMAVGAASGKDAAIEATKAAMQSSLTNTSVNGATGVIYKVLSSKTLTFGAMNQIKQLIYERVGNEVELKQANHEDETVGDEVRVTIIATGIEGNNLDTNKGISRLGLGLGTSTRGLSGSDDKKEPPKSSGLSIPKDFK